MIKLIKKWFADRRRSKIEKAVKDDPYSFYAYNTIDSGQNPSSNYDLILDCSGRSTGLQVLNPNNNFNIDSNKTERITFNPNDPSFRFILGGVDTYRMLSNAFSPTSDGTHDCGRSSFRWDTGYGTNDWNFTSDRELKTDFEAIPSDFIDVLIDVADSIQQWKWKEAKKAKGNESRWHIGPIAQEIYHKFKSINVDAFNYGFIGKDKKLESYIDRYEVTETKDGRGNVISTEKTPIYEDRPVLNDDGEPVYIWNIRKSELQFAISWAQQQKINEILACLNNL
tara:strand:- start:5951 stop:6796 length:846 start_codon:yes stop_codon:yes gene_type:complete